MSEEVPDTKNAVVFSGTEYNGDSDGVKLVLGLFLANGCDERFIPGEKTLTKLEEALTEQGHPGAPRWFHVE
jgi:hypothetical protein